MKLISWNVNGMRAVLKKNFMEFFEAEQADIFCVQETKMKKGQATLDAPDYLEYWYSAERPGYSGTGIFTKKKPLSVVEDIENSPAGNEGRVLTLEYEDFYIVCAYSPNSQDEVKRLPLRLQWEEAFLAHLLKLKEKKSVIACGDLNVAHEEIDLRHPKNNRGRAGFTDEERAAFSNLLSHGFIDSFRALHPEQTDAYTWWSYRFNARKTNAGWRIDYFVLSEDLAPKLAEATIYSDVYGSDHCPIGIVIQ